MPSILAWIWELHLVSIPALSTEGLNNIKEWKLFVKFICVGWPVIQPLGWLSRFWECLHAQGYLCLLDTSRSHCCDLHLYFIHSGPVVMFQGFKKRPRVEPRTFGSLFRLCLSLRIYSCCENWNILQIQAPLPPPTSALQSIEAKFGK